MTSKAKRRYEMFGAAVSFASVMFVALPVFAEEAEDVGFPQLEQVDTFAGQIFWLLIAFCLLFAVMSRVALPGVERVLDQRSKQRRDDLEAAERDGFAAGKVRKSFEASLAKAQDQARHILDDAGKDVAARTSEDMAKFGEIARKRAVVAEENIAKAKQAALSSLADMSADLAVDMASRIAGLQVSKAEAQQAVAAAIKE